MPGTHRQNSMFKKTEGYVQSGNPFPVTSCGRRRNDGSPIQMTDASYAKKNAKMRKDTPGMNNQQTSGTSSARVKFAARFGGQGHSMKDKDGSPSGYAHALKRWGFSSGAEAKAFANKNKKS